MSKVDMLDSRFPMEEDNMATTFQDDERENEAIKLFGLVRDDDAGRSGTDAYLDINGMLVPFELKSASRGSVTTVRDFGPDHIAKWKEKHWLIGFYNNGVVSHYVYGNPQEMDSWIQEKWRYVKPDFDLAEMVPPLVTMKQLVTILGHKTAYSLRDAQNIQKMQYKKEEYLAMMDIPDGYSQQRMLEILQDRAGYLMRRGSTLNNPHIPGAYFDGLCRITSDHAATLRSKVSSYLNECIKKS
ncbi:MAG: hypothetical protein HQL59_08935 [Magnetococcales bacterium]|nr:hypothetical protein [Magnetococcales bacterium]